MEFRHIIIEEMEPVDEEDHTLFAIRNKHSNLEIGVIIYYEPWKKWVLEPYEDTIYDESCLEDIVKFMKTIEV